MLSFFKMTCRIENAERRFFKYRRGGLGFGVSGGC